MEKIQPFSGVREPVGVRSHKFLALIAMVFSLSVLVINLWPDDFLDSIWPHSTRRIAHHTQLSHSEFDWKCIEPSDELVFHPCFCDHQCARLSVPMDWNSTSAQRGVRVALAIIKRPAKVPITDPRYAGPVLLNPGGPGGSGVALMLGYGKNLQTVLDSDSSSEVDPEEHKFFDVMSWDPRGINNTTPNHPGLDSMLQWDVESKAIGTALDDPEVFAKVWARAKLYGSVISSEDGESSETPHVGRFVTTANVVRDMVEIIERHGQWREREAHRIAIKAVGIQPAVSEATFARLEWKEGQELLQYWGFSYGTVIGQTFATLQPHRVGRMVLDGVVNAGDYTAGSWASDLMDTDRIAANFTATCAAVGPSQCPMAKWASDDPEQLQKVVAERLESLKLHPVASAATGVPTVVSHSDVMAAMLHSWYSGFTGFKDVARYLWELSQGNVTHFASPGPLCPRDPAAAELKDKDAAGFAILCVDGDDMANRTQEDYAEYAKELRRLSPLYGNTWAMITMACSGYNSNIRPKWRFAGPFGARTRNGILFASQSLDPVTPLRNARGASKLFPGSAVLEAQGIGHCTLGYPNPCAMKAIRAYFRTGDVPEGGLTCAPAFKPFDDGKLPPGTPHKDAPLYEVTVDIANRFPNM